MTSFLPTDYKVPTSSNYMKFNDGENTFRVLSSAIVGYEYWNTENKPVRSAKQFDGVPVDIKKDDKNVPAPIKHFWAFIVWNYNDERVQVLELTQKSIMGSIKALVDNKKWGDPKGYDLTVNKTGEGLNTEYTVMPNPHAPLEDKVKSEFEKKQIDLTVLFEGGDPFGNK